jgi:hypothetical protein
MAIQSPDFPTDDLIRPIPNRVENFQTRIGFPKARHEFDAQMSRSLARIVVHELTRICFVPKGTTGN